MSDKKYPIITNKVVRIETKIKKSVLPEEGFLDTSATAYMNFLSSAFAGANDGRQLGRTIWEDRQEEKRIMSLVLSGLDGADSEKLLTEYWTNYRTEIPYEGRILQVGTIQYDKESPEQPSNPDDYILWRYAKAHSKVANSFDDISKSNKILFYLVDEEAVNRARLTKLELHNKADALYFEHKGSIETVKATLYVANINAKDDIDRQLAFSDFRTNRPNEFIAIVTDRDLIMKAIIRSATLKGIITNPNNTTLYLFDSRTIGNDLNEVVAFLTHTDNAATLSIIKGRLKA